MRVLVTSTPLSTHFLPLVPLACALRAAGHEVLVLGQPDILAAVRSAGLNAVVIGERVGTDDTIVGHLRGEERLIHTYGRPAPEDLAGYPDTWIEHTVRLVPEYLRFARAWRPDLIVSDPLEFKSLVVGGVLGVPVAHHRWGVDPLSRAMREGARPGLAGLCRELGLPALPDPTVVLDPCPPSLQLPDAEPARTIRNVPFNGNGPLPSWLSDEWLSPPGDGARRRVVVSMGARTLALNGVPLMRRVLHAFDGLTGTEAVATIEPEYAERVGDVPDNVRVIGPTPLHLFLDSCHAMVHHGGTGTVTTATVHGLPQLALPQAADQWANGDRLAEVGAGITLDTAEAQDDPARVRDAVVRIVTEPSYREVAAGLRREAERMPSTAAVVEGLEQLAARP
ncbi:nucleotide disphospho-sugar-binding domain-containing protein [Streptomyces sp. NPDC006235]|uniref:nucleotide disphospho-sugar-binding domain-containing protein n=1 Tax=Streptomyces sp. NPDC006235 TaxID=3156736 RepID=UPI0033B7392D